MIQAKPYVFSIGETDHSITEIPTERLWDCEVILVTLETVISNTENYEHRNGIKEKITSP